MPRAKQVTSATSGKTYEVVKIRTESSNYLPLYHFRRLGDTDWRSLGVDTIAEARRELNAPTHAEVAAMQRGGNTIEEL